MVDRNDIYKSSSSAVADRPGADEAGPVGEDEVGEQLVGGRVDGVGRERVEAVGQRRAETQRQHVGAAGVRRVVDGPVQLGSVPFRNRMLPSPNCVTSAPDHVDELRGSRVSSRVDGRNNSATVSSELRIVGQYTAAALYTVPCCRPHVVRNSSATVQSTALYNVVYCPASSWRRT